MDQNVTTLLTTLLAFIGIGGSVWTIFSYFSSIKRKVDIDIFNEKINEVISILKEVQHKNEMLDLKLQGKTELSELIEMKGDLKTVKLSLEQLSKMVERLYNTHRND